MKGGRAWDPLVALQCLYTDGVPRAAHDEESFFAICEGSVKQIALLTATTIKETQQEEEEITAFALTPTDVIVSASRNNMFRYWTDPMQCWRSDCAVVCMEIDPKGSLLAAGGGDNSVRVYQLGHQYLTHCFKDHHAPILAIAFHPTEYQVISCSYDYTVKVFDLLRYKCAVSINVGEHPVRLLAVGEAGVMGVTGGLEVIWWELGSMKELGRDKVKREGTALAVAGTEVYIGDESGKIAISTIRKKGLKRHHKAAFSAPIISIIPLPKSSRVLATTNEHSVLLLSTPDLALQHQILGHIDEIVDLKFVPGQRSLLLANNSSEWKRVDFHEIGYSVANMKGHSDTVLCIGLLGEWVVTGSKDNTVRLWKEEKCVCVYEGHAHSISSVGFYKRSHIVSGSLDQSIKIWQISESGPITTAQHTCIAHLKSVNVVKTVPDGKMIISGGHDKAIKIWNKKLQMTRQLDGHKRGVWDLDIHWADKTLVSASGDMTLKMWSLVDFACLRTFEGHTNSVIRVKFLPESGNVVSTSSDALVKVFNAKNGVCTCTFDQHDDKIWGLDTTVINNSVYFATGAADSKLILWKDVTLEEEMKETEERRLQIAQEQEMNNKLKGGKRQEAAVLALSLNRPMALFNIIRELNQSEIVYFVDQTIDTSEDSISALIAILVDWNTQKKFCSAAHKVLVELLERIPFDKFPQEEKQQLRVFAAYSEKHYQRVTKMLMNTFRIEHFLQELGVRVDKKKRGNGETKEPAVRKARKVA